MKEIIHDGNEILRAVSKEVSQDEIQTPRIQGIMQDMKDALASEKFGVAIAAPQIGESVRIFVVGGKVYASREGKEYDAKQYPDQVFINPEILKASKKMRTGDEGCLSVPFKYGIKVVRHEKITISYYDEQGEKQQRGASSFLAQVFQHEIDHLNGILYTDHAPDIIRVDVDMNPLEEI
tara:strand:- start:1410 stop:1946 length:537 start_codon:yes stop_codon:yes gene_type:complete